MRTAGARAVIIEGLGGVPNGLDKWNTLQAMLVEAPASQDLLRMYPRHAGFILGTLHDRDRNPGLVPVKRTVPCLACLDFQGRIA